MGFQPLERESSRENGRSVGFRDLSSDSDPDKGFRSLLPAAAVDGEHAGREEKSRQVRNECRRTNPAHFTEIRCDSKRFRFTVAQGDRVEICEQTTKKAYRMWVDSDELKWIGSCLDFILLRPETLFLRQLRTTCKRKLSLTYRSNSFGFCATIVEERQQGRTSVVIPEGRGRFNLKHFRAQIRSVVCELKAKCKSDFIDDLCLSYEPLIGRERTGIEFQPSCCLANISTTAAVEAPSPSRMLFLEELKREGWWVDTETKKEGGSPPADEGTLLPVGSKAEMQKDANSWERSKGVRGEVGRPKVLHLSPVRLSGNLGTQDLQCVIAGALRRMAGVTATSVSGMGGDRPEGLHGSSDAWNYDKKGTALSVEDGKSALSVDNGEEFQHEHTVDCPGHPTATSGSLNKTVQDTKNTLAELKRNGKTAQDSTGRNVKPDSNPPTDSSKLNSLLKVHICSLSNTWIPQNQGHATKPHTSMLNAEAEPFKPKDMVVDKTPEGGTLTSFIGCVGLEKGEPTGEGKDIKGTTLEEEVEEGDNFPLFFGQDFNIKGKKGKKAKKKNKKKKH